MPSKAIIRANGLTAPSKLFGAISTTTVKPRLNCGFHSSTPPQLGIQDGHPNRPAWGSPFPTGNQQTISTADTPQKEQILGNKDVLGDRATSHTRRSPPSKKKKTSGSKQLVASVDRTNEGAHTHSRVSSGEDKASREAKKSILRQVASKLRVHHSTLPDGSKSVVRKHISVKPVSKAMWTYLEKVKKETNTKDNVQVENDTNGASGGSTSPHSSGLGKPDAEQPNSSTPGPYLMKSILKKSALKNLDATESSISPTADIRGPEKELAEVKEELIGLREVLKKLENLVQLQGSAQNTEGVLTISAKAEIEGAPVNSGVKLSSSGDDSPTDSPNKLKALAGHTIQERQDLEIEKRAASSSQKRTPSILERANRSADEFSSTPEDLLEELFPEEHDAHNTSKIRGSPPRLLPPKLLTQAKNRRPNRSFPTSQKRPSDTSRKPELNSTVSSPIVLRLANTTRHLSDTDFVRLIPKGKHIADWKASDSFFRIIAVRDSGLRKNGRYILIFPSRRAAREYLKNVAHIHKLVKAHTPTGMTSIMTPPGYLIAGEDIHATLQNYTLTLPTQNLSLQIKLPPLSPALETMIRVGGYQQLVPAPSEKVIFWVEGQAQPSPITIKMTIERDGVARGLPWGLKEITILQTATTFELDLGRSEGTKQKGEAKRVLRFESERAAVRFWRFWHRREWPTSDMEEGDVAPTVNIERV